MPDPIGGPHERKARSPGPKGMSMARGAQVQSDTRSIPLISPISTSQSTCNCGIQPNFRLHSGSGASYGMKQQRRPRKTYCRAPRGRRVRRTNPIDKRGVGERSAASWSASSARSFLSRPTRAPRSEEEKGKEARPIGFLARAASSALSWSQSLRRCLRDAVYIRARGPQIQPAF